MWPRIDWGCCRDSPLFPDRPYILGQVFQEAHEFADLNVWKKRDFRQAEFEEITAQGGILAVKSKHIVRAHRKTFLADTKREALFIFYRLS
jgi:hypothetical protein